MIPYFYFNLWFFKISQTCYISSIFILLTSSFITSVKKLYISESLINIYNKDLSTKDTFLIIDLSLNAFEIFFPLLN